jgi:hypothetical protein
MNTITIVDQSTQFEFENIGEMVGFEYPEVISVIGDISGQGGAVYLASKFGRRRLSWQGLLKEDVLSKRRALEMACKAGRLKTIKFTTCDGIAVQTQVEVERLTMPYKLGRTKYLIEATAPDWRFFAQTPTVLATGQTIVGGGADIPASIPMDIYHETSPEKFITNAGTENASPVFRITGPGTRFIVSNKSTGEQFVITQTLDEDDYITVNVAERRVLLNGITPIYSALSGTFWSAAPGITQIGFVPIGRGNDATLETSFYDAWLGI